MKLQHKNMLKQVNKMRANMLSGNWFFFYQPSSGGDAMLSMIRLPEHVRLEHLQEEFDLASDEELNRSKR